MLWRKEFGAKHLQSLEIICIAIAGLLLTGTILQNLILSIAAGVFVIHLVLFIIFDKTLPRKFSLGNQKRTIRLFPNEVTVWKIELENRSHFPLINGEVGFNLGSNIRVLGIEETKENYWQNIQIPVSLMPQKKQYVEVSLTAVKRGTARVNQLHYQFPHLFSFHHVVLRYVPYYRTEFIVYPEMKKVSGLETVFYLNPGEARTQHSPFEDIQSPMGTRNYSANDSFQRINWKASVRAQELQTNIYEKVVDRSFVVLANLKQEQRVGANVNMENLLSYTAYLCKYAAEQKLPYELFINVFHPGKQPFIHHKEDSGITNPGRSLELLARIPRQAIITPFEEMLYQIVNVIHQPKTIIILGDIPKNAENQILRLEQMRHTIFQVREFEDGAMITPLAIERIA